MKNRSSLGVVSFTASIFIMFRTIYILHKYPQDADGHPASAKTRMTELEYDWTTEQLTFTLRGRTTDIIEIVALDMDDFERAMRDHLGKMRALLLELVSRSARWMQHVPSWLENIDRTFDAAVYDVRDVQHLRRQMEDKLGRDIVYELAQWTGTQPHLIGSSNTLFYPILGAIPGEGETRQFYIAQRKLIMNVYAFVDVCGPCLSHVNVRKSTRTEYSVGAFCVGCHTRFNPCSYVELCYGDQRIRAEVCEKCFEAWEMEGHPIRHDRRPRRLPEYYDNYVRRFSDIWDNLAVWAIWKAFPWKLYGDVLSD